MRKVAYRRRSSEQGYVLMLLLLTVTLVLISLTAGLPAISAELKRQREEELIHRGVQYTRAIRNYYHKFHTYPASLEQLEETNHIRFLRKRYKDPMTGSDFRLLHVGEVQLSMRPDRWGRRKAEANNAAAANSAQPASSPQPFVPVSAMGAAGLAEGGGPICGVASTSDKQSFQVFDEKEHYKDWQFVYSPVLERAGLPTTPYDGVPAVAVGLAPGLPQPQPTAAGTGAPGTVNPANIKH